jgi:hypothetical protein
MAHALANEHAMQRALFWQLPTTPEPFFPPPDDETFEAKIERLLWSHLAGLFWQAAGNNNLSAEGFEQLAGLILRPPVCGPPRSTSRGIYGGGRVQGGYGVQPGRQDTG